MTYFADGRIDSKRRSTLPAEILRAAGIEVGAAVVIHSDGPGRIVVETEEARRIAARVRIHSMLPPLDGGDATVAVRTGRDHDNALVAEKRTRQLAAATSDPEASEQRGAELLARLGL